MKTTLLSLLAISSILAGCASTTPANDNSGALSSSETSANNARDDASAVTISGSVADARSDLRVALIWRIGDTKTWKVGEEAKVEGGRFSILVSAPPSGALADAFGPAPVPPPPAGELNPPSKITPKALGAAKQPQVAYAGLVAYVDKNGNSKLDLDANIASTDEVIAASSALTIEYFGNDGLDAVVDTDGRHPHAGFNLSKDYVFQSGLDGADLAASAHPKLSEDTCGWNTFFVLPASFVSGLCYEISDGYVEPLPPGMANPPPAM